MLRISSIEEPHRAVTLRLEGQIRGPWLAELRQVCEQWLATGHSLILDLTDVSFIDLQGVALCQSLRDQQVVFIYGSLFVAERLKG